MQNSLLTTLPSISREWAVEFDFWPNNYDQTPDQPILGLYTNVLHMTTDGNFNSRIPGVWCKVDEPKVLSVNFADLFPWFAPTELPLPPIGQWSTIRISQEQLGTDFVFRISIADI